MESIHSINESIRDFSEIVTTNHKEPRDYLAIEENSNLVPSASVKKRVLINTSNHNGIEEDQKIPGVYDSQSKRKQFPENQKTYMRKEYRQRSNQRSNKNSREKYNQKSPDSSKQRPSVDTKYLHLESEASDNEEQKVVSLVSYLCLGKTRTFVEPTANYNSSTSKQTSSIKWFQTRKIKI